MNRKFENGGFVVYWMLNMCTMASCTRHSRPQRHDFIEFNSLTFVSSGNADGVIVHRDRSKMGCILPHLLYVTQFCCHENLYVFDDANGCFRPTGIVVNVAGSFQSFELMPRFYQYGYAFPFFNSVSMSRDSMPSIFDQLPVFFVLYTR